MTDSEFIEYAHKVLKSRNGWKDLAGEILATLELNFQKELIVGSTGQANQGLSVILANWRRRLNECTEADKTTQ